MIMKQGAHPKKAASQHKEFDRTEMLMGHSVVDAFSALFLIRPTAFTHRFRRAKHQDAERQPGTRCFLLATVTRPFCCNAEA